MFKYVLFLKPRTNCRLCSLRFVRSFTSTCDVTPGIHILEAIMFILTNIYSQANDDKSITGADVYDYPFASNRGAHASKKKRKHPHRCFHMMFATSSRFVFVPHTAPWRPHPLRKTHYSGTPTCSGRLSPCCRKWCICTNDRHDTSLLWLWL